eukprot:2776435-Amphidinium_carterae.3
MEASNTSQMHPNLGGGVDSMAYAVRNGSKQSSCEPKQHAMNKTVVKQFDEIKPKTDSMQWLALR